MRLPHQMVVSKAFKSLSPAAKAILIDIWSKYWSDGSGTDNNGEIPYGVREAAEIGISRSPAALALAELQKWGFLAVEEEAAFNVKRRVRRWRITACRLASASPQMIGGDNR